jgi:hypothetical protein
VDWFADPTSLQRRHRREVRGEADWIPPDPYLLEEGAQSKGGEVGGTGFLPAYSHRKEHRARRW